jgi:hypothetical protein
MLTLRKERKRGEYMLESTHIIDERATTYMTGTDFCKIFTEEMNSLYLLAFLLTADSDKAEQCFVRGWESAWKAHVHSWIGRKRGLGAQLSSRRFG